MGQLHAGENPIQLIVVEYSLPEFIRLSQIVSHYCHVNMLIGGKCLMAQLMDFQFNI